MKNQVLLLDGGGTQTLPIAKSIFQRGHSVHIFYEHKLTYGYATRYATRKTQSPSIREEMNYLAFFKDYVERYAIDTVIPMSDASATFLSRHKSTLLQLCKFIIPDYPVYMKGYDKNQLMAVCKANGIPHPKTIDLSVEGLTNVDDSIFPAILKPNLTTGGRGMKILSNRQELERVYEDNVRQFGNCHLQEFVASGGHQFKVQIFIDANGQVAGASSMVKQRFYPVSGGSSCFNTTLENDHLVDICHQVLSQIGWVGFADFDLIEDPKDGVIKIMEINPRIPACVKSAVMSGVDYGNIIVDATSQRALPTVHYVPGKQLRHLGFDILWFFQSKERFSAKPGWFNFFNRNQSFQDISWMDPLPFVFGTIGNIQKILSSDFRKTKNKAGAIH